MARPSRRLYGNCVVLSPDSDRPMFRCDRERMEWYLERKLAVLVSEDPPVLRLTFQPKGPGHAGDSYFLQGFKNQCVVCGSQDDLSHHHIVPDGYRRYFPRISYVLGRWMYDVLLLCVRCHERYERMANEFKETIAVEYGIPSSGISNLTRDKLRFMKAAIALERHGDKIPEGRRTLLEGDVKAYLGKDAFTREDLALWKEIQQSIDVTPPGEMIISKIPDIDDFAIRWRWHFMTQMKPRFLPSGWNPERRIYSEPDNQ